MAPPHSARDATRREMLRTLAAVGLAGLATSLGARPAPAQTAAAASLTRAQTDLVAAVADTILPATDTPGAVGAGVPAFVATMTDRWMRPAERQRFLAGMAAFDAAVKARAAQPFGALTPADRLTRLVAIAGQPLPDPAALFIAQMKALTVYGYYTSEIGATQELEFNIVPGEYDPCAGMKPGQHAYSMGRGNPVFQLPA